MTTDTTQYATAALRDLDDSAAGMGVGDGTMEARFARTALGTQRTGVSLQSLAPGAKQPFAHRHEHDEEIYVVTAGSGRAIVDGEPVELVAWTALRLAPTAVRTIEAGDDGLEWIAFGAHTEGDGEVLEL